MLSRTQVLQWTKVWASESLQLQITAQIVAYIDPIKNYGSNRSD